MITLKAFENEKNIQKKVIAQNHMVFNQPLRDSIFCACFFIQFNILFLIFKCKTLYSVSTLMRALFDDDNDIKSKIKLCNLQSSV